jgi:hypothetical protein
MATVLTQVGEEWIADKLTETVQTKAEYIAWGSGAGTSDKADTSLFSEESEARVQGTESQPAADKVRYVGTLTADGTKTITNAGTFTASTAGVLVVKGDFTGIPLQQNDQVEFTIDLEIT